MNEIPKIFKSSSHKDNRGVFSKLLSNIQNKKILKKDRIIEINYSFNKIKGTIRGFHYQKKPKNEQKLIICNKGKIIDVIIDLRKKSKNFLKVYKFILSDTENSCLFIPHGFAHGFQTLVDDCELIYFHSESYSPSSESGVAFNDPSLNITWPNKVIEVSTRDKSHKLIDMNFQGAELI